MGGAGVLAWDRVAYSVFNDDSRAYRAVFYWVSVSICS